MYCSAQYLAIPYGDSGSGSTSSRDGMGASRPYRAPPEEANSTRAPAIRAASRTLTIPTTLTCASSAGAATEERTSICEARWQISSGRTWLTTAVSGPASVMLSLCSVAWSSRRAARPADRSSITATSSPRVRNASVRCDPMTPAPPVTSTRMLKILVVGACLAEVDDLPGGGEGQRARIGGRCFPQALLAVVPRHQVGQHQLAHVGAGGILPGLPPGEMQVLWQPGLVEEGRLAQQQIRPAGQAGQGRRRPGVGRVSDRPARMLNSEAERFPRVIHRRQCHAERPDLPGPGGERVEVERLGHAA